jgi:acetylornithine aminotransferase
MSDEVQCGLGRTGKWFVYQHAGFLPDVVPLAKGLAGGVPVGACVVGGRAKGVFKPGNHGSTFGGNPLAMRGVVTTLDTMKDEGLLENAARVGTAMKAGLAAALQGVPGVVEVRGMGLMIGVELDRPCSELVKMGLDAGLVFNVTADSVIRLLPALVISETEGREVVERLAPLVKAFLAQGQVAQTKAHAPHPASAAAR